MKVPRFALAVTVTTLLAACDFHTTEPGAAAFVKATVQGNIEAEYTGTGTFRILPPSVRTPFRFDLGSRGVGTSENQSFHFHGRHAPAKGTYAIQQLRRDPLTGQFLHGELEENAYFATYSYREGSILKIFTAKSGAIHVTESTTEAAPRRIGGTFQFAGVLYSVCKIVPGFPGDFLECEPATEEATVEITGSFRAGPLGGDNPGLTPSP